MSERPWTPLSDDELATLLWMHERCTENAATVAQCVSRHSRPLIPRLRDCRAPQPRSRSESDVTERNIVRNDLKALEEAIKGDCRCPVCGGFMFRHEHLCSDCERHKRMAEDRRRTHKRIQAFGRLW